MLSTAARRVTTAVCRVQADNDLCITARGHGRRDGNVGVKVVEKYKTNKEKEREGERGGDG